MVYQYNAVIERVVDADTYDAVIDLGFNVYTNKRLRLKGVDAPETWRPESEAEKAHGTIANAEIEKLIQGKNVLLTTYKYDKYGRYLCDVQINDVDVGQYLVDNGLVKLDSY